MKYGMPNDRLYVTYFGGAEGLDSDEDTRQFWLDMGYDSIETCYGRSCSKSFFKRKKDMTLQSSEIQ